MVSGASRWFRCGADGAEGLEQLTQGGEPPGYGSVDLIQDDDDDEVDDGGGGFHRGPYVGACCRVGADVERCLDADPIQDDPEDYGKGCSDL